MLLTSKMFFCSKHAPVKKYLLLLLLFIYSTIAFAAGTAIVKGTITDKRSREPMIGAVITLKNTKTGGKTATATGLDGSYLFKNVSAGSYELEGKFISYSDTEIIFTVAEGEVKNRQPRVGGQKHQPERSNDCRQNRRRHRSGSKADRAAVRPGFKRGFSQND